MATETTFFSYSRSDSAFVLKLASDLRNAGADIWLDQIDIKPGSHWDKSVEAALNSAQRLIVVLSPTSVSSDNVMDEVSFALGNGKTVIPILLSECTTPFRIKRLQRIDFTGNYQTGLNKLIKILDPTSVGQPAKSDTSTVIANKSGHGSTKKGNWKKYLFFGGGGVLISVGLWWAMNSGSEITSDQKDWTEALQKNDSSSYALYLKEFPEGKYYHQAKEKLDSIHNKKEEADSIRDKELSDSLAAVNKTDKPNQDITDPSPQKKPNSSPVNVNNTAIEECHIWKSNLTIIQKTYSHSLGEAGKTFTNRARLKQVVSNIDLNSDASLNKMKTKLLSFIDNAPSHSDPYYDMEFTQDAKLIRDQIEIDIQKHVDKCK